VKIGQYEYTVFSCIITICVKSLNCWFIVWLQRGESFVIEKNCFRDSREGWRTHV